MVECLKQPQGIIFGYKINVLLDHKNLVYAATLSESQRAMRWRIIIKEFGPNIIHIYGVENIVSKMLSRLPSPPSNKYEYYTGKAQCRANKLFTLVRVKKKNEDCFALNILIVQREQKKELRNINYKLSTYI